MKWTKLRPLFFMPLAALVIIGLVSEVDASRRPRAPSADGYSQGERQTERLRRVMLPLLRVANQKIPLDEVSITIVDDPALNAGAGGNGRYYVTTGLLNRANDDQLRGVLAHEIAHEDLHHPAKAQVIGVGISLGAALLEQFFPSAGAVAPIAGTAISASYTRPMELAADRHAVTLLERAGYSPGIMAETLAWLMREQGDTGGGLLATHPATSERINALQSLR